MNKKTIKIDIISDVVCPWCYIGKRRLEKALKALENDFNFKLEYHPFELNPYLPQEGVDQKEYLSEKFGGRYEQLTENVTRVAEQEGLKFDFAKQLKLPNTFNAHRLISFAKKHNKQIKLTEILFSAYFEKGIDLTINENLIEAAVNSGLERKLVTEFLNSDEGLQQVRQQQEHYIKLGVTGVPFFVLNNKYGISGAQNPETFIEAIKETGKEVASTDESCSIDNPNC